ncbi:hypothetical protein J437_LFUL013810 [Ladona fulva]|uniref:Uncharacterized protein n=1 Tax=Ladona fulva TaxID=123851 RepID=A0A8K0P6R0_LADFU|nr:hypothetical protein J437_LFUL013810 [Ladona fulva]
MPYHRNGSCKHLNNEFLASQSDVGDQDLGCNSFCYHIVPGSSSSNSVGSPETVSKEQDGDPRCGNKKFIMMSMSEHVCSGKGMKNGSKTNANLVCTLVWWKGEQGSCLTKS